jgi:hypothetical protein
MVLNHTQSYSHLRDLGGPLRDECNWTNNPRNNEFNTKYRKELDLQGRSSPTILFVGFFGTTIDDSRKGLNGLTKTVQQKKA